MAVEAQQPQPVESRQSQLKTIARLRTAEYELRNASILVSLDPVKCELFTFHRRSDLLTDARTIYGRLSTTLKANACIISYKSTTRASDLLNPENSRLYQLLMSALILSVRSVLARDSTFIPLSASTFVYFDETRTDILATDLDHDISQICTLYQVNLQLLKDGQVLVTSNHKASASLHRVFDLLEQSPEPSSKRSALGQIVWLAPMGQIARCNVGRLGKLPLSVGLGTYERGIIDGSVDDRVEPLLFDMWKEKVEAWLVQEGVRIDWPDSDQWIEVQVPVTKVDDETLSRGDPSLQPTIMWHRISWPSSLCFLDMPSIDHDIHSQDHAVLENQDPIQSVEDWITGAEARAARIATSKAERAAEQVRREQAAWLDGGAHEPSVDSLIGLPRLTSQDVHAINGIYPTPPDGPLSQVTPGMSSLDGIAMTPVDGARQVLEAAPTNVDNGIPDARVGVPQTSGAIGTGLYDEDLFEEMPGDKFGASGIADEPNWDDFFGEPENNGTNEGIPKYKGLEDGLSKKTIEGPTKISLEPRFSNEGSEVHQADHGLYETSPSPSANQDAGANFSAQRAGMLSSPQPQYSPREQTGPTLSSAGLRTLLHSVQSAPSTTSKTVEMDHNHVSLLENNPNQQQTFFVPGPQITDALGEQESRYSTNGRFWFEQETALSAYTSPIPAAPRIPILGVPKFDINSEKTLDTQYDLGKEVIPGVGTPQSSLLDEDESDFHSSDFFSGDERPASPSIGNKRKWSVYSPASPTIAELTLTPGTESAVQENFNQLLELLRPDPGENLLIAFNPVRALREFNKVCNNPMIVAQLLVEQVSQSSLSHGFANSPCNMASDSAFLDLTSKLEDGYGRADEISLQQLVHLIEDSSTDENAPRIAKLDTPQVRVQRSDRKLEALPSILPFWESLGLQPAAGQKNVMAFCIHPIGRNVEDGCVNFLQTLEETYTSCNLGEYTTGKTEGQANDGCISWSDDESSHPDLAQACERLATTLSHVPATQSTVMVYMINPCTFKCSLLELCEAFYYFFTTYVRACGKRQTFEVALQIVPISFVASAYTLAIPTQAEYLKLALEVYARCPPAKASDEIALSTSAVVLANPPVKDINFSLSAEPTSPLSKGGKWLHVAYSKSPDERWITACWTDTLGEIALTMCYCVHERGSNRVRPIVEVIRDIWEVSLDIMQTNQGEWRLAVATGTPIDPVELNSWSVLINEQNIGSKRCDCSMTLLSVDTNPALFLRLPPPQQKQALVNTSQPPSWTYGTPASTPQPATTSPGQPAAATPTSGSTTIAVSAPTPPDHGFDPNGEPDVILADPTDESWAVLLSHGLNNSHSMLDARPALVSSYLLKRKGSSDLDGVATLGVNLLSAATTPNVGYREMLRDILGQYRGLVTLAKARGVIDPVGSVLPWHVATAEKGSRVLGEVM